MPFVVGVFVTVVKVVHVVAVLDRFMGTVRSAVLMLGRGVFGGVVVFVVVAVVLGMAVPVVEVVHMVAVLDGCVIAVSFAVPVLGKSVFGLDFLGHDVLLCRTLALGDA